MYQNDADMSPLNFISQEGQGSSIQCLVYFLKSQQLKNLIKQVKMLL